MRPRLEEIDWRQTPLGEVSLRRRVEPTLGVDVYEVRLGDEFLMSSLFTVAEVALAQLGLAEVLPAKLDVLVGGLGLGYTAEAVLQDRRVARLYVVETLQAVIDWHQQRLLPMADELVSDPRTRLVHADFFELMGTASDVELPADLPARLDAILLDIDHTPRHVLHPRHAAFYTATGLRRLADRLRPSGVFGLWSDDPPDDDFIAVLDEVFTDVAARVVTFANHYTGGQSANTVYLARRRTAP